MRCLKKGTTLPRLPRTLPYRTHVNFVDRLHSLVGAHGDDALDICADGCPANVLGPLDIGLHRLVRRELTVRHLLEGRGVKDDLDSCDGLLNSTVVADIPKHEL